MFIKCVVIIVVILVLVQTCDSKRRVQTKFKRKVGGVSDVGNSLLSDERGINFTSQEQSRGFFGHGKLLKALFTYN